MQIERERIKKLARFNRERFGDLPCFHCWLAYDSRITSMMSVGDLGGETVVLKDFTSDQRYEVLVPYEIKRLMRSDDLFLVTIAKVETEGAWLPVFFSVPYTASGWSN